MSEDIGKGRWALILGASSGFGEACARALAGAGYHIFGVHLDRRAGLEHVEQLESDLRATGRKTRFFNINAADPVKMEDTIESFERVAAGEFDHLPEQAFYMAGGIDDVVAAAAEMEV